MSDEPKIKPKVYEPAPVHDAKLLAGGLFAIEAKRKEVAKRIWPDLSEDVFTRKPEGK